MKMEPIVIKYNEDLFVKIAIASGKGGTGKTTVSTNLAAYLAQQIPVILCDLDVEEPNSGLFIHGDLISEEDKFKHVPQWNSDVCTFCGKCQEVCNFHAVLQFPGQVMLFSQLCHSCYACSELCPADALPMVPMKMGELREFQQGNLTFIESKLQVGQEQAVPLIAQTLDYIEEKFSDDIIRIFDAPPGTSCPMIESTKDADFIILVTEPTPFGFHDLKLAIETVRQLGKEFAVVINRSGIGNEDVLEYCEDEGIQVIAQIPNQKQIAELYSQGDLIYPKVPEFQRALDDIATAVVNIKKEVAK